MIGSIGRSPLARRRTLQTGALLGAAMVVVAPAVAALGATTPSAPLPLVSFTDHADAPGMLIEINGGSQTQGPQAGTIPEATSDLASGVGHGLGSLAWPGSTAGNIGSVIAILGAVPPSLQQTGKTVKDPARAETLAPQGPADAVYPAGSSPTSAPMRSHADINRVEAWGETQGVNFGGGTSGPIISHSKDDLSSGASVTTSSGDVSISKVALVPGPVPLVTIDSITSTAAATSDGVKATAVGKTTVSGLKVAGQPATVDQNGLHVASSSSPLGAPASNAVNTAIAQSGLKMLLATPTTQVQGGHGYEAAGGLVIQWTQNGYVFTVTFGGASAEVQASPGLPSVTPPVTDTVPAATAVSLPPVVSGGSGGSPSGSTSLSLGEPPSPVAPSPSSSGGTQVALGLAGTSVPFKSIPPALAVVGAFAAGLCAFGLRRLPTNVLEERPNATTCPLEGAEPGA